MYTCYYSYTCELTSKEIMANYISTKSMYLTHHISQTNFQYNIKPVFENLKATIISWERCLNGTLRSLGPSTQWKAGMLTSLKCQLDLTYKSFMQSENY